MIYLKNLWNWWKNLETWEKVCLLLPIIILSAGLIFLLFSPIKPKFLKEPFNKAIKHNKASVDYHIETLEEQDKEIEVKQTIVEKKIDKTQKEVERKEKDAKNLIKEIDNASDDIASLLALHKRLSARRNSK